MRKRPKQLDADSINVDDEECDYEGDVMKLQEVKNSLLNCYYN